MTSEWILQLEELDNMLKTTTFRGRMDINLIDIKQSRKSYEIFFSIFVNLQFDSQWQGDGRWTARVVSQYRLNTQ